MFCPNCAAPIEGAKFCRSCGANVSLVPQALTGELPKERVVADDVTDYPYGRHGRHGRRMRRRDRPPSLAKGIQSTFMGIGFLLVALAASKFAPAGEFWWFWLLIPTFALLGGGVAEIVRAKEASRTAGQVPTPQTPAMQAAPNTNELPPRQPAEFTPGSIIEGTTRNLEPRPERERR
jgi:hypothetical protein